MCAADVIESVIRPLSQIATWKGDYFNRFHVFAISSEVVFAISSEVV